MLRQAEYQEATPPTIRSRRDRRRPPRRYALTTLRGVERRQLGSSDLRVSVVSLGAMTWGGGFSRDTRVDEDRARRLLDAAVDAGVNLVDTAENYGGAPGRSEEVLGRLLDGRRDRVLVATKVGYADRGPGVLAPGRVIAACEASLRRLGTDHIDLYLLHRPDRSTPLDDTVAALETLLDRGMIRAFGLSNHRAWEVAGVNARQRALGRTEACAVQVSYSLAMRDVEHEIQPCCHRGGIGMLAYAPLAGGQLAGRARTPSAAGRAKLGALPGSRPTGSAQPETRWPPSPSTVGCRWRRSRSPGCSPSRRSARWSPDRRRSHSSRTTSPPPTWPSPATSWRPSARPPSRRRSTPPPSTGPPASRSPGARRGGTEHAQADRSRSRSPGLLADVARLLRARCGCSCRDARHMEIELDSLYSSAA